mmetsp:Transcript_11110/g.26700  ORF Transcript_11110/g.26700 Transcript_11110/m.26700 type:complete len:87 (+) Transcript_11110:1695-1955(+)
MLFVWRHIYEKASAITTGVTPRHYPLAAPCCALGLPVEELPLMQSACDPRHHLVDCLRAYPSMHLRAISALELDLQIHETIMKLGS